MISIQAVEFIRKKFYYDIILEKLLPIEKERFPEMFVENTNTTMDLMYSGEDTEEKTTPTPVVNNTVKSFENIEFTSKLSDLDETDLQWMDFYFNQLEFLNTFYQQYFSTDNYETTYTAVKYWFKALLTEGYWDPDFTDKILTNYYETKVMNYTLIKESSNYFQNYNSYEFFNIPKWFYNTLASINKFKEEIVKEDGSINFKESRIINKIYYNLFDAALIILTRSFILVESSIVYGLPFLNQLNHIKESAYQNLMNFSNFNIPIFKSLDSESSENFDLNEVLEHNKEAYFKYKETFIDLLNKFNVENYSFIINEYKESYNIKEFELLYSTRVEFCKDCLSLVLLYEIIKKEKSILDQYNILN